MDYHSMIPAHTGTSPLLCNNPGNPSSGTSQNAHRAAVGPHGMLELKDNLLHSILMYGKARGDWGEKYKAREGEKPRSGATAFLPSHHSHPARQRYSSLSARDERVSLGNRSRARPFTPGMLSLRRRASVKRDAISHAASVDDL